ncbi:MAG: class I adenylate-forming enzyme family protein, partial [Pseudomonadota bacterium]
VFTSGSTGHPKLVLYSQKNIETSVRGILALFDRSMVSEIFCYPQPYHTFGLSLGYGASLLMNWSLRFRNGTYSRDHHRHWLETLVPGRITLGTPTHFTDLIHWIQNHNHAVSPSYSCIVGGAKVQRSLWFDIKKSLEIQQPSIGYGATEASPGITHLAPGVEPTEDGDIGELLDHVQVRFQPDGFQFSGDNVCLATIENGSIEFPTSLHLPDLIDHRQKGHWIYQGRSRWTLNRGGEKFSLEKLENDLSCQNNCEFLCLSLPHARLGEELGILVKHKPGLPENLKERVFKQLKKQTQRQFDPQFFKIISEFPFNDNLKVDRREAVKFFNI